MKYSGIAVLLLAIGSIGFSARAQVIVSYEFTGNSFEPTTVASEVTASAVSKSPNITNVVPYLDAQGNHVLGVGPINGSTSASFAVTLQQYFQFEVAPPNGSKLNLAALTFLARKEAPNSSPRGWVLRSSTDGFAANLATAEVPSVEPTLTAFVTNLPPVVFTGISEPVTFRIYTYQSAPGEFVDYDDIQLFGITDAPPRVGVFSSKKVVTSKGRIRLRGNAFDDIGVAKVTVGAQTAVGTTEWKAAVRLKSGTNRIRVFATDVNGAISPKVTIRVKRVSPLGLDSEG